jgi:8-oxo-dGTP diphosphatase
VKRVAKERFKLISAVHLFLIQGDQILLLRRYNTGYEDGKYSVPAGHLDGGEEIVSAAIREAKEECGIEILPEDVQVVEVMHRKSSDERIDFFLAATKWTGEIRNAEPDKCDELRWVDMDRLPENTIPYVRRAIENYRAGRWFDSYGWEKTASKTG